MMSIGIFKDESMRSSSFHACKDDIFLINRLNEGFIGVCFFNMMMMVMAMIVMMVVMVMMISCSSKSSDCKLSLHRSYVFLKSK